MNIRLKLKKILIKMNSIRKSAKRRSFALIALLLQSLINWSLEIKLSLKIMYQLIIFLFFLDALGFSLFRSIEKKSLQISEDALKRASDEEKIVLVNSVIKSVKVDEKTASSLQEIKKSLDIKLNNKK